MANEALSQLQAFFHELFQFDLADLDFGLYRLFHLKREEIEKFITESLPQEVDAAFSEYSTEELRRAREEYDELKARMEDEFGADALLPDGGVKPEVREKAQGMKSARELVAAYEDVHRKIQAVQVTEGHKAEVFNHLYAFFSRYYEDGDFIPKRRYGSRETYAVPYDGEEVFFHWANRDQYYVKTGEHFRDYTFKVANLMGEYRVRFTMAAASIPRDNTKGKTRYFFPRPDLAEWSADDRTFVLPFEYRLPTEEDIETHGRKSKPDAKTKTLKQEYILQDLLGDILSAASDENLRALLKQDQRTGKQIEAGEPELPLLLKRMTHFCRKNTSDFFIHKDLRGFLTRELDFYVKDQVLHAMDVEADWDARRRVIRVFRRLADKVIEFLANIEDAEKRLFEKKKFVLETDYLIPMQHVPESFWPEILAN
ncbi:MAG: site-specific DNA-methyltransferase, partial [Calditrichaeota bacterium]